MPRRAVKPVSHTSHASQRFTSPERRRRLLPTASVVAAGVTRTSGVSPVVETGPWQP
jgi:hypothetical protein